MNTLKSLFIAFAVIFLFSNADCEKKLKVEKDVEGGSITLAALPQAAGTFDFTESVNFNLDSVLQQYDLTMANLLSIEPVSATITLIDTSASPVTFDIIDNVSVELGSTTIPNKRVAFKDPMPKGGLTTFSPDVDPTTDVIGLAQGGNATYHFKGTSNAPLTHPVQIKFEIKWHVVGQL